MSSFKNESPTDMAVKSMDFKKSIVPLMNFIEQLLFHVDPMDIYQDKDENHPCHKTPWKFCYITNSKILIIHYLCSFKVLWIGPTPPCCRIGS